MGTFFSRLREDRTLHESFGRLGLTNTDVLRLLKTFEKVDTDGSSSIEVDELLDFLHLPATAFSERIFTIFDEDGSGEIDFDEFVISMWNYCTLDKAALIMFAFDMYDEDTSGVIDSNELDRMLQEIYGQEYKTTELAQQVREQIQAIAESGFQEFDVERFAKFCRKHPAMLFPCFNLQRVLQQKILGQKFWDALVLRQVKLGGLGVSMGRLHKAQINYEARLAILHEVSAKFSARAVETDDPLRSSGTLAMRRVKKGIEVENFRAAAHVAAAVNKFKAKGSHSSSARGHNATPQPTRKSLAKTRESIRRRRSSQQPNGPNELNIARRSPTRECSGAKKKCRRRQVHHL